MNEMDIKKLRPTRLSDSVIDQLIELIVQKKLLPGEKLPSERKLAEYFGVSRTSIREAIKTLSKLGLFKTIPGKGIYLMESVGEEESIKALAYPLLLTKDIEYFFEARELIQVEQARLAAQRASEADIAEIKEALNKARAAKTQEEQAECDVKFDLGVARAAKNTILIQFLASIKEFTRLYLHKFITTHRYRTSIAEHTRILESIEKGDSEKAAEAMEQHLNNIKVSIRNDYKGKKGI